MKPTLTRSRSLALAAFLVGGVLAFEASCDTRVAASPASVERDTGSLSVRRHVASWYRRVSPSSPGAASDFLSLEGGPRTGLAERDPVAWRLRADPPRAGAELLGFDFVPNDDWVLGVAVGYEPRSATNGLGEGDSPPALTVAPYLALVYGSLSIDLALGYTATPGNGASPPGPERFFVAGGLSYVQTLGQWVLSGRVGGLWVQSGPGAVSELDLTLVEEHPLDRGQLTFGADVGYSVGTWEPFVAAGFQDAQPDGGLLGLGVRFRNEGVVGSIYWDATLDGETFDQHRINFLIRSEFD